ncbi:hypothetical protein RND81_04G061400 [Saponaria officinalis]|uniref:Uncharacterized protein n=1 Tax=Saponaria officinalis TaxID=3572 RepID=A0AAW1LJZ2_SAPOF
MGRKGNWFSAVKKALHNEPKEDNTNNNEPAKSKKKWFKKKKKVVYSTAEVETTPTTTTTPPTPTPTPVLQPVTPPIDPPKLSGVDKEPTKHAYTTPVAESARASTVDREQTKHAYSVALATAKAAEAAVAAAQAAAEVVRLTTAGPIFADVSKEETAAIKIQTLFRGYMARRRLRAIRGLIRLKSMMQGPVARRQSLNTLKCMQTLARMQSQIRERRLRMAEDNLARQIQHKNEKEQAKELEKLHQVGDGWDASGKTKEQIEAKLQSKHEAAIRRERTLAYAFSHQQTWKGSPRSATTLFMDSNNPHWGWSWLERWLAARPWESATMESSNENSPRTKASKMGISGDEILKAYTRRHTAQKTSSPSTAKQPRSSTARLSTSSARKMGSPSPKGGAARSSMWGLDNDDVTSTHSEQSRRLSVTGSDAESQASSQNVPSYMAPTEAAKARSRFAGETKRDKSVTPDRSSVSSTKKRASHTASPARSRWSNSSAADATSTPDHL